MKFVFSSGLTLEGQAFSLVNINAMMQWSEIMVCPSSRKSRRILPILEAHITLPTEGCVLNFFFSVKFTCRHSMDYHFYYSSQWWHHISLLAVIQSRKISAWFHISWLTCIRCSFCSCVKIHGTHLEQTQQYFSFTTIIPLR